MSPSPSVSSSSAALATLDVVRGLQRRLVQALQRVGGVPLTPVEWLRDGGRHGGGVRFETADRGPFQRASVNFSHVHYDDDPRRPLRSATALSAIIHPLPPRAPSLHVHVSCTELFSGSLSWRIMGDLNPSIPVDADTARFRAALADAFDAAGAGTAARAFSEGDRYFFIPALGRHRGVCHAYLEGYRTDDAAADRAYARACGEAVIDVYASILDAALRDQASFADDDARARQRAYHTLYLFQVLTLDRGTTSGLLVHDENDQGIMGSLPGVVDTALLASWTALVPAVQRPLVRAVCDVLGDSGVVDADAKRRLAQVVRDHFRTHPEALELQARGSIVPPTVARHAPQG